MMAGIRYHKRGVYILNERVSTRARSTPAPMEWIDIFHQKFTTVVTSEMKAIAIKKDFRKLGTGNLKII